MESKDPERSQQQTQDGSALDRKVKQSKAQDGGLLAHPVLVRGRYVCLRRSHPSNPPYKIGVTQPTGKKKLTQGN